MFRARHFLSGALLDERPARGRGCDDLAGAFDNIPAGGQASVIALPVSAVRSGTIFWRTVYGSDLVKEVAEE